MTAKLSPKPRIIVVVGPTSSGKSALAVALAKKFNGEVISADSRQIYKGMNLGTGKVTKFEMKGVPHHLLDIVSPKRTFSAGQYRRRAAAVIRSILRKRKLPILAGGTGFYIDALLERAALPEVKPNPVLRRELSARTTEALFRELQKRDPRRAAIIDRANRPRLIRALEIVLTTKRPVPTPLSPAELAERSPYDALVIGINPGKEVLHRKISKRFAIRLRRGMVQEVRRLHEVHGISWQRLDDLGLDYRYVSRYLRGMITKEEMRAEIEKENFRYAKRQMTWFKRDPSIHWIKYPKDAFALAVEFLAQEK